MNHDLPSWYLTTEEFAALLVGSIESAKYFDKGKRYHPEDLASAFFSVCQTAENCFSLVGQKEALSKKSIQLYD